jgi:hypothetical protein
MSQEQHFRRRCSYCAQVLNMRAEDCCDDTEYEINHVEWRSDPFQSEIHDDYTLLWLCDECHYNSLMEV